MERTTWATGPTRLLRLVKLEHPDGGTEWFWWDVDEPRYQRYQNLFWEGTGGWCGAWDWAALHGYTLSCDRIFRP